MHHNVTIDGTGESYACAEDESLLAAMARLGRRGIPLGCRGGGCGVCKIEVVSGDFMAKPMSREHVSFEDLEQNRLLACRVFPRGNLSVKVIGKMSRAVCSARSH